MSKITKYIKEASERAKRRKSPWNFILIPLSLFGIGFFWSVQFKILWFVHIQIYPEHYGRFSEFWQEGISPISFISSFLLIIPVFFSSIPLGMIVANLLAWCIPSARRTFKKEAQGYKGATLHEAMKGLVRVAIYFVPICFILGLIGAVTLKSLK